MPRRYQSGEVDYTGSISKCGDRRVRTLLYEAANVMLTRYKGPLKLKDWAVAIAKRSTMRKARIALARRLAIIMHAMLEAIVAPGRRRTDRSPRAGCVILGHFHAGWTPVTLRWRALARHTAGGAVTVGREFGIRRRLL